MKAWTAAAALIMAMPAGSASAQVAEALTAPGDRALATLHASGAQIYECRADAAGALNWQFREPVAALFVDGRTVGRHYAGPTWELADGSLATAKVAARAPGAAATDIPELRLEITSRRGDGLFARASAILRIKTRGGTAEGACAKAGALLSVPYAADYVVLEAGSPATR